MTGSYDKDQQALAEQSRVSEPFRPKIVELSESEAIRGAQHGDEDAFECIYRLHCRRVYALCLRMTEQPAEAEDLTQEVFLTVFRKIQTFRGDSAFSTWLHRVTVNLVLMRLRRRTLLECSLEKSHKPEAIRAGLAGNSVAPICNWPDLSIAPICDAPSNNWLHPIG